MSVVWWIVIGLGVISLLAFARQGPNAVCGTATLGAIIGIGIAFFSPPFAWLTIAKAAAIGAIAGAVMELPHRLSSRRR